MKVLMLLTLVAAAVLARPDEEHYDIKLENIDIDTLVENERLLKGYVHCFLDKSSCTPEGKSIKKILPEAVETICAKCSPQQRTMVRKMIIAFKEKLPQEWEELVVSYDPEKKHDEDLNKFLAETD